MQMTNKNKMVNNFKNKEPLKKCSKVEVVDEEKIDKEEMSIIMCVCGNRMAKGSKRVKGGSISHD